MPIRILIFLLFLYSALVWVLAALVRSGPEMLRFGLRWTAVGLLGLILVVVGSWTVGWLRIWRARRAARPRPATFPQPAPAVHEDDAALASLIAEANRMLAKAPSHAGSRNATPIADLPLYLLVGPPGSGKTSTFINSGLEPQLLAGQVAGTAPVVSTRLCNIWLANGAVFVELSGRVFTGDLARWTQLLRILRGGKTLPAWRQLLGETDAALMLKGVISFCDVKDLTEASSDSQQLERRSREWHDRLLAIGDVFKMDFPVYQVISKCDTLRFYSEYFRHTPESELNQVFGWTYPEYGTAQQGETTIEAEAKRLIASFRSIYSAVVERRVTSLASEPDPADRPAIYEFPREFKRIRTLLVQFLSEIARPHPLRPGPLLRGYYLTATRESAQAAGAGLGDTGTNWDLGVGADVTRLFRSSATQLLNLEQVKNEVQRQGRNAKPRWMFTADLFRSVIFRARPVAHVPILDPRIALYRRAASAAAIGLCAFLCCAFLISWAENRRMLADFEVLAAAKPLGSTAGTGLMELRALESLRLRVVRLTNYDRDGAPFWYRWGLYSGDRLLKPARETYFRRFQQLLLNPLNAALVERLSGLPPSPGPNDPYDPVARLLKAHLMISTGGCTAEPAVVADVLKQMRQPSRWPVDLVDPQIDFYARELPFGNPCRVSENAQACDRARAYLAAIKGIDRIYRSIIAKAEATVKSQRLGDLARDYPQVLSGPASVSFAYSQEGWGFVQKAAPPGSSDMLVEPCLANQGTGLIAAANTNRAVQDAVNRFYIRDYIAQWRNYVAGFSVLRYRDAGDAGRKLNILASHNSPLLALFALAATQTNFTAAKSGDFIEKAKEFVPFGDGKKTQKTVPMPGISKSYSSPLEITAAFQPVHLVVPPDSRMWVVEKNKAYIEALEQLQQSMEEIARAGASADPAIHVAADQNAKKALQAVDQIALGFQPIGVEGLDKTVVRLLKEPIHLAQAFIQPDRGPVIISGINKEMAAMCTALHGLTRKYPFRPDEERENVSLAELTAWFAPETGRIAQFRAKSLGELVVREGSEWKAKDPAKKPQVTPELLDFLRRSDAITNAFFAGGATQPHLTYTLRPALQGNFKDGVLEVDIDGQHHLWTSTFQKQFTWPAPEGKDPGARAWVNMGGIKVPFASHAGLWGIFRIMKAAKKRPLGSKVVEWTEVRPAGGGLERIEPVDVGIVEFPGGVDMFNPEFFSTYQCSTKAVQ